MIVEDNTGGAVIPREPLRTGLAKASILLSMVDGAPTYDIFVRRSFAEYVASWLQHAGTEYGIRFE